MEFSALSRKSMRWSQSSEGAMPSLMEKALCLPFRPVQKVREALVDNLFYPD